MVLIYERNNFIVAISLLVVGVPPPPSRSMQTGRGVRSVCVVLVKVRGPDQDALLPFRYTFIRTHGAYLDVGETIRGEHTYKQTHLGARRYSIRRTVVTVRVVVFRRHAPDWPDACYGRGVFCFCMKPFSESRGLFDIKPAQFHSFDGTFVAVWDRPSGGTRGFFRISFRGRYTNGIVQMHSSQEHQEK